jgi:hypothetical protein
MGIGDWLPLTPDQAKTITYAFLYVPPDGNQCVPDAPAPLPWQHRNVTHLSRNPDLPTDLH